MINCRRRVDCLVVCDVYLGMSTLGVPYGQCCCAVVRLQAQIRLKEEQKAAEKRKLAADDDRLQRQIAEYENKPGDGGRGGRKCVPLH